MKHGDKGPKADEQKQIRYTANEKKIIRWLAEELQAEKKAIVKIGQHIDTLVRLGGIIHGDETIEKIAKHPDINCSSQHLRYCWNLHRLVTEYAQKITAEWKEVCHSAMFQIARLLALQDDEKIMLADIDDCIHKTVVRDLAVDEVREMVSRRLDEFGKLRKKPKEQMPKVKPAEAKVVVTDEFDLVNIADGLSWMSDPEKFEVCRIVAPETRMGLTRLISELVSISRRLPDVGPNEDLGNVLIKKGRELEEIGRQLLEPSETHMEGK